MWEWIYLALSLFLTTLESMFSSMHVWVCVSPVVSFEEWMDCFLLLLGEIFFCRSDVTKRIDKNFFKKYTPGFFTVYTACCISMKVSFFLKCNKYKGDRDIWDTVIYIAPKKYSVRLSKDVNDLNGTIECNECKPLLNIFVFVIQVVGLDPLFLCA